MRHIPVVIASVVLGFFLLCLLLACWSTPILNTKNSAFRPDSVITFYFSSEFTSAKRLVMESVISGFEDFGESGVFFDFVASSGTTPVGGLNNVWVGRANLDGHYTYGRTDITAATDGLFSAKLWIDESVEIAFEDILKKTIAHEIGHMFGLAHCNSGSCSTSSGNSIMTVPTESCCSALSANWGDTGPNPCDTIAADSFYTDISPSEANSGGSESCPESDFAADAQQCEEEWFGTWNWETCECDGGTPIILDLGKQNLELEPWERGVYFDLYPNGRKQRIGWTSGSSEDAFLVVDRNGNGFIDDGSELFGSFTVGATQGDDVPNGFLALSVFDDNADGAISSADGVFPLLQLWTDSNHDGISQSAEIIGLSVAGVESIDLTYRTTAQEDQAGNQLRYFSLVKLTGRGWTRAFDVILAAGPSNK